MLPMAMLTIDLPETPQAQPAYRLAADCPHCGAPLVLRQNRQTGALFTGCSAYPGCAFTGLDQGIGHSSSMNPQKNERLTPNKS